MAELTATCTQARLRGCCCTAVRSPLVIGRTPTLAVRHPAVSGVVQVRLKRLDVGDHPIMIPAGTRADDVKSGEQLRVQGADCLTSYMQPPWSTNVDDSGAAPGTALPSQTRLSTCLSLDRGAEHAQRGAVCCTKVAKAMYEGQHLPMRWKVWLGMCSRWPIVSQGPRCETSVAAYRSARAAVTFDDLDAAPSR